MTSKQMFENLGLALSLKNPVLHWRLQRLTAVALLPLIFWLLLFLNKALHASYTETANWLSQPFNSLCAITWTLCVFYHAALGVQVVIEDYTSKALRHKIIALANLVFLILALVSLILIFCILLPR